MLLSGSIIALGLTIAVELPIGYLLGYRKIHQIVTIISINLATNPVLNFLLWLSWVYTLPAPTYLLIILEVLVVFAEAALLKFALRVRTGRALLDAVFLNVASFSAGLVYLTLH